MIRKSRGTTLLILPGGRETLERACWPLRGWRAAGGVSDSAMIRKIGLLLVRENRRLLCRKSRGTTLLIPPGGRETLERACWPLRGWRAAGGVSDSAIIRKVGLLLMRENRRLLCRKSRGTTLLIMPGRGGDRGTGVLAAETVASRG